MTERPGPASEGLATAPTMTVAVHPAALSPPTEARHIAVDVGRAADAAGVDRLLVVDHVVMAAETASYPWGDFPATPDVPWPEPLTLLAAIAAVTERVRLATGIVIAPLRPAALLAKTVATLDVLSGGRVDLGVGTGWQPGEFQALGVPFERRGTLLTEVIGACRQLWEHSPASYAGELVSFDRVWCNPKPLQDRLPVWFSGLLGAPNLERITTLGDGWLPPPNATVEEIAALRPRLLEAWDDAGRGPSAPGIQMRVTPVDDGRGGVDLGATMDAVGHAVGSGATDIRFDLRQLCPDPEHVARDLAQAATAFRSEVG